jgi:hypothetical protein
VRSTEQKHTMCRGWTGPPMDVGGQAHHPSPTSWKSRSHASQQGLRIPQGPTVTADLSLACNQAPHHRNSGPQPQAEAPTRLVTVPKETYRAPLSFPEGFLPPDPAARVPPPSLWVLRTFPHSQAMQLWAETLAVARGCWHRWSTRKAMVTFQNCN